MYKTKLLLLGSCIFFIIGCKNQTNQLIQKTTIDDYLEIEVQNTLGLAVAVLKDGKVIYKNYLGNENTVGKPVDKKTIFPLYSVSKLITSTAIFQLIEEDKIHLDDKISLYIDSLPKKWQHIEIKHLLTHSSGLPDYDLMKGDLPDNIAMGNLTQDKLHFQIGKRWEYNQTNFWFLTKIINKVTKGTYEKYITDTQFPKHNILFSSNFIDSIPHRSFKYNFNTTSQEWEKLNFNFGNRANSAGGINLTLNQIIDWTQRFDNNKIIKSSTKQKMWTPFDYEVPFYFADEKDQFLYGWQQYSSNQEVSYGFTGGMVTGYRKFINQNMTIIVLTNGLKETPIRNKIINKIAGFIDNSLTEIN